MSKQIYSVSTDRPSATSGWLIGDPERPSEAWVFDSPYRTYHFVYEDSKVTALSVMDITGIQYPCPSNWDQAAVIRASEAAEQIETRHSK